MVDHHHRTVDPQTTAQHQAMVKKRDMSKAHQAQLDQLAKMERTERMVNKVNQGPTELLDQLDLVDKTEIKDQTDSQVNMQKIIVFL